MDRLNRVLGHFNVQGDSKFMSSNKTAFTKAPLNVCVSGAAGNIAYAILFMISQGRMLGADQPINLRLLDIAPMEKKMQGVVMELQDGGFPLLQSIVATSDYKVAFDNVEIAMLIGAKPRGPGQNRSDLLKGNAPIFVGQGKALDKYANRNVKVLVVGNPANTNALIAMKNAPSLRKTCFSALTRLDQNRAKGMLANRTNANAGDVRNIIIWGNHSPTMYADVNHGSINGRPIREVVNDCNWIDTTFRPSVAKRGGAIIKARGASSAASAANAAVDHMREWHCGTPAGEWSNMAVCSDDNPYGIPSGIMYSFPCVCTNGSYKIVEGLSIDGSVRAGMDKSAKELVGERQAALG